MVSQVDRTGMAKMIKVITLKSAFQCTPFAHFGIHHVYRQLSLFKDLEILVPTKLINYKPLPQGIPDMLISQCQNEFMYGHSWQKS